MRHLVIAAVLAACSFNLSAPARAADDAVVRALRTNIQERMAADKKLLEALAPTPVVAPPVVTTPPASDAAKSPSGYPVVWSDDFKTLSLRTGGPTFDGLAKGNGTWASPGVFYSQDAKGVAGYGFDWFLDPTYRDLGQIKVAADGLHLRAMPAPADISALTGKPWIGSQLTTRHSVQIKPPFYVEYKAKVPAATNVPFAALWLNTGAARPYPNDQGKEYEIDVWGGFGDSDRLHSTLRWHTADDRNSYPDQKVVDQAVGELSTAFHTWGALVEASTVTFYFDGMVVGTSPHPAAANWNQLHHILLNVSAGTPWDGKQPVGSGFEMVVEYVKLFAPDKSQLQLN